MTQLSGEYLDNTLREAICVLESGFLSSRFSKPDVWNDLGLKLVKTESFYNGSIFKGDVYAGCKVTAQIQDFGVDFVNSALYLHSQIEWEVGFLLESSIHSDDEYAGKAWQHCGAWSYRTTKSYGAEHKPHCLGLTGPKSWMTEDGVADHLSKRIKRLGRRCLSDLLDVFESRRFQKIVSEPIDVENNERMGV